MLNAVNPLYSKACILTELILTIGRTNSNQFCGTNFCDCIIFVRLFHTVPRLFDIFSIYSRLPHFENISQNFREFAQQSQILIMQK